MLLERARVAGEVDGPAAARGAQQPQHRAIATGGVALPVRPEEPRATARRTPLGEARAMDLPTLRAHDPERARKRWRHGAHQVMDLERRPRPVDASVLGPAAPEILPGLDGLGSARRRAGDEARERARQHDLGGDRDLGEHLAGIVLEQDRDRLLIDDVARIRPRHHVVQRRAGLALAFEDGPVDRRAPSVLRQKRAVHVEGATTGTGGARGRAPAAPDVLVRTADRPRTPRSGAPCTPARATGPGLSDTARSSASRSAAGRDSSSTAATV